jgi:release factor glutamine methyltransferase
MTVGELMHQATATFEQAGIPSARLDAQVLLERALKQNKAWLLAHGEEEIPAEKLDVLQEQIRRRTTREPLAYILGTREFYGRNFEVTPDVLIPRPATEQLVEQLKTLPLPDNATVLDVGTGSGAIAVTVALELPHTRVSACDISPQALAIAEHNAERLGAPGLYFFASDLLEKADTYDLIVANLPYVDRTWERSPETAYEPEHALFAEDNGLEFIKKLLAQAPDHLHKKGFLVLEADPRQFGAIKKAAGTLNFVRSEGFTIIFSNNI